jgi:hypothetical protein
MLTGPFLDGHIRMENNSIAFWRISLHRPRELGAGDCRSGAHELRGRRIRTRRATTRGPLASACTVVTHGVERRLIHLLLEP